MYFFWKRGFLLNTEIQSVWAEGCGQSPVEQYPFETQFQSQVVEGEMADVQKQHSGSLSVYTEVKTNHNPSTTVDALVHTNIMQRCDTEPG